MKLDSKKNLANPLGICSSSNVFFFIVLFCFVFWHVILISFRFQCFHRQSKNNKKNIENVHLMFIIIDAPQTIKLNFEL